jgi:hypothetical protein
MFSGFGAFFLVSETHAHLYSGPAAASFSNPFSQVHFRPRGGCRRYAWRYQRIQLRHSRSPETIYIDKNQILNDTKTAFFFRTETLQACKLSLNVQNRPWSHFHMA